MKRLKLNRKQDGGPFEKPVRFRPKYAPFMSWFFLIILFINLIFPKSNFEIAKENSNHQFLGEQLFNVNQLEKAAVEFWTSGDKTLLQKIDYLVTQPEKINQNILFYKNLIYSLPDYRDAYIQTAIFYQKIYQDQNAKYFIDQGLVLDPNNEVLNKLKQTEVLPLRW